MKRKITSIFIAIALGVLFLFVTYLVFAEIWINWQHSEYDEFDGDNGISGENYSTIVDSETGDILTKIKGEESENCLRSITGKCRLATEEQFGPLKLGAKTRNGEGMSSPYNTEIAPASFYVYIQRRGLGLCIFDECGIAEGKVVQCMGGWLSGDGHPEISDSVGLDSGELSEGRASIVLIANSDSRIIGIFPYHTEGDIIPLLYRYPEYRESLHDCIDEEIGLASVRELTSLKRPKQVPQLSGAELQVWVKQAKTTAILMPDGSVQDTKGQILYEPSFDPSEERYHIYRTGYGHYVEHEEGSGERLSFKQKSDAIEWIKNEMKGRGYTVIDF